MRSSCQWMTMARCAASAAALALTMAWAAPARAIELQFGAEAASFTESKDQDFAATSTVAPFIAIGSSGRPLAVFLEVSALDYSVNAVDTTNLGSTPATYHVTGTSIAGVVAAHLSESVALRLGIGQIQYHFSTTVSDAFVQSLAPLGVSNISVKLDDATATFYLLGFDWYLTSHFLLGLEYRPVTLNITAKSTITQFGSTYVVTSPENDSFTWTALRAALVF